MGVGLSFAGFSSAAVAELPPARFATGSAISACFRQLGAVLGISVLIAILGAAATLADFHRAYALMAVTGATAALIALTLALRSRYRPDMDLEERTLDDTIARTCAVCGAKLTSQEIQDGARGRRPVPVHRARDGGSARRRWTNRCRAATIRSDVPVTKPEPRRHR